MSGALREALRTAAELAPPPVVTDGLWRRGRRRRRWRRTGAAVAGVLAVVVLVGVPRLLPAGDPGPRLAVGDPGQGELGRAYPWLPEHAQDPHGPAVAMFTGGGAGLLGPSGVLVGADGSYRLVPVDGEGSPGLLSPDGTLLARPGGGIVDLRDGSRVGRRLFGRPVAWSPVGQQLLMVVTETEQDPETGAGVTTRSYQVYDVDADDSTFVMSADIGSPAGAFSPDGTRVAVVSGGPPGDRQTLQILDLPEGRHLMTLPLENDQRLAGTGGWTPDGRSVVLVKAEGCGWPACRERPADLRSWHLQYADATWPLRADDPVRVTDEPARRTGLPGDLTGWRDGLPVLVEDGRPALVAAEPDGSARVLLTGPGGAGHLSVPRQLAEAGTFGVYAADPWQVRWWAFALPLVALGALLWTGRVLSRRGLWRRRRAWRAQG